MAKLVVIFLAPRRQLLPARRNLFRVSLYLTGADGVESAEEFFYSNASLRLRLAITFDPEFVPVLCAPRTGIWIVQAEDRMRSQIIQKTFRSCPCDKGLPGNLLWILAEAIGGCDMHGFEVDEVNGGGVHAFLA